MGSVAASGAFYIACGAKKVFANPGTITGSIGVIMEFANLQKLYEWAKIQRYSLKTGKYKDAGADYREMNDEEKALLQGMINDVLVQFKHAVSVGRKMSMEDVSAIADGRILSGNQAKAAGLIDELGTIRDAINEAARQGNIKGKPNVVYVEKLKRGLMDLLTDDSSGGDSSSTDIRPASLSPQRIISWIEQLAKEPGTSSQFAPGVYWLWKGFGSGE
jgi:protease-4